MGDTDFKVVMYFVSSLSLQVKNFMLGLLIQFGFVDGFDYGIGFVCLERCDFDFTCF